MMTGKFQGRFSLEGNGDSLDGFNKETTIATRLQQVGYATAQLGKWHLGAGSQITTRGFHHVFSQNAQQPFDANITLAGRHWRSFPLSMMVSVWSLQHFRSIT
jgi:arylsulfatase A-like enzyme